jgi:predicted dehydrogenase
MKAPVRLAVVGAGYWGPNLIRTFLSLEGAELALVCDRSEPRLAYVRERFPGIQTTASLDDVLADESIEAVAVATPVSTHREVGEVLLKAGKHVFIEKPLARTIEDARLLVNLAARLDLQIATGHVFVHHPAIVQMRCEINSGSLGRPLYSESARVNLGPPASEVDVIWDLAVHDVAILLSLIPERPIHVSAVGRRFMHPSLNDVAFLRVEFASGFIAHHYVSWLSPLRVRRFFVAGSSGSATFDDMASEHKLMISGIGTDTRIGVGVNTSQELYYKAGDVRHPELPSGLPLTVECSEFLSAVRGSVKLTADGTAGLEVVAVLQAASDSVERGGGAVSVDF